MAFYSGMMKLQRLQVLTMLAIVACYLSMPQLTYGLLDQAEYNSIYSQQLQEHHSIDDVGRFPFLMPNVRPKTVSEK